MTIRNCDKTLLMSVINGMLYIAEFAIDEGGADVNVQNGRPLIEACKRENAGLVKCLLKRGADVSVRGYLPLKIAHSRGNSRIEGLLLKRW